MPLEIQSSKQHEAQAKNGYAAYICYVRKRFLRATKCRDEIWIFGDALNKLAASQLYSHFLRFKQSDSALIFLATCAYVHYSPVAVSATGTGDKIPVTALGQLHDLHIN